MANQCYHAGNFWQCVTATSAGESPTTTPESWRKIKLPSKWRWALAQLTFAHLLVIDGQNDKANEVRSIAYGRERVGLDDLIRQEANEEQRGADRRGGARVNTGRTLSVDASVILNDAWRLNDKDPTEADFDTRDKNDGYNALSQAVQEVWEAWWWQELMVCEQQSLPLATTNLLEDATWTTQSGGGSYYQVTGLTVGRTYRLTVEDAILISESAFNTAGFLTPLFAVATLTGTSEYWLTATQGSYYLWTDSSAPASGALGETLTVPAITLTTPYGPVRKVSKFDPRISANAQEYELDVTGEGTRVIGLDVPLPWVWSRRVTPSIDATDFDAAAAYEATDPEKLVYDA